MQGKEKRTMKFSKELMIKCQEYFKENYSVELAEEKVDEYLDKIADFYIALVSD